MNEVLRRKMFRTILADSRAPNGILASSPEMVETVQRRANGGYNTGGLGSQTVSDIFNRGRGTPTRRDLSGAGLPEGTQSYLELLKQIKDLPIKQQQDILLRAGYGVTVGPDRTGIGTVDPAVYETETSKNIMSFLESLKGTGQVARPGPTTTQARVASGVESLLGPKFDAFDPRTEPAMAVATPAPDKVSVPGSTTVVSPETLRVLRGDELGGKVLVEDIVDDEYTSMPPIRPGEELATTTSTQKEAQKDAEAETKPKSPKGFTPLLSDEVVSNLTSGSLDAESENNLAKSTGNAVIDQALSILQGTTEAKSEAEKAKGVDETIGITGTRKERIQKRKAVLQELLGERAKDIRTDANYNLMMTGLMIAAGESSDMMTNIAKGLAMGLKGYGDAVGEEAKDVTKEDRALTMMAAEEVGAEITSEKAAALKAEQQRIQRAHEDMMQNKRLATALAQTQAQLGSSEAIAFAKIASAEKLAANGFEQNLALFGLKADQEKEMFDLQADLKRELADVDTETMKLMKVVQADAKADGFEMSDLDALVAVKQAGATAGKATDTTLSYNRLISAGMRPMDAWLLSNSSAVTEMIKDMGAEEFENFILGKLAQSGQQTSVAGAQQQPIKLD